MRPIVTALDHLVLTVADIAATCEFYEAVLGMEAREFAVSDGSTRWALFFGPQKINLHEAGTPFSPHALHPTPGSADLCFLTEIPIHTWEKHLASLEIEIEEGPVARSGAAGPILSLYIRDPDGNLIEISSAGAI